MELSTSTNLTTLHPGGRNGYAFNIEQCAKAGYKVLDINLCEAMNPTSRLRTDEWEKDIEMMRRLGDEYGITYRQSHLPYYDLFTLTNDAEIAEWERLIHNMIHASGMLGVEWCVTHPGTVFDVATRRASLDRNLEYYADHVRTCEKAGTGLALENVFEYKTHTQRSYGSYIEELVELVDAFNSPTVKACYDFGHAQLVGGFHRENLNLLGDRLVATHVADNDGKEDLHLLPFFGVIDWTEAMQGLKEIDYQGDFTYEAQRFGRNIPNDKKAWVTDLSIQIGRELISRWERFS